MCPWNRRLEGVREPERHDIGRPDLTELLALSGNAFKRRFAGTPVLRARRKGLARNAAGALGNVGDERALPALTYSLEHDGDAVVRSHAGWALARLRGAAVSDVLRRAAGGEPDARCSRRSPAHGRGGRFPETVTGCCPSGHPGLSSERVRGGGPWAAAYRAEEDPMPVTIRNSFVTYVIGEDGPQPGVHARIGGRLPVRV